MYIFMFKITTTILFLIALIVGVFYWTAKRDMAISKYWEDQYTLCGKVGYYHIGGGYCEKAPGAN